jgi:uncharacterized membrane protein
MTPRTNPRFWELDLARGAALLMMLVANFMTVLDFFGIYPAYAQPFWFWFARITAFLFVFIAGIALTLSIARSTPRDGRSRVLLPSVARRGAGILAWGLVITAVTWLAIPETYIRWGVLHLIGFGILVTQPLAGRRALALVLGVALCAWGYAIGDVVVDFPWLIWLGYQPATFRSEDYFPVAPWLGIFVLGVFAGDILYPAGLRAFPLAGLGTTPAVRALSWLGCHTLPIYLLHQPLFVIVVLLTGLVPLSRLTG